MSPSSCRSEVRCTSSVQNLPWTSCGAYYWFGIIVELLIDVLWCYTAPWLGDFAGGSGLRAPFLGGISVGCGAVPVLGLQVRWY